jgi:hypothetical protein
VTGDPTRRRARDTYYRNTATARLRHQFGTEDSVYAQFLHGILKNDDPAQLDSQEFSPSVGLTYWFSTWTGIDVEGGYIRGLYDEDSFSDFQQALGRARLNRRLSPRMGVFGEYKHIYRDFDEGVSDGRGGGAGNDYMVYAPSAGIFYEFDKNLRASFGGGYFYQQVQNADDEQGPFVNADINKLWDFQRWNIRARASSGLDSQDFSAVSRGFERYAQAELIGHYDFTRQFFGDAGLRYRYGDFLNSEDDVVDHRYRAEAGLGYKVFRWMTLRLVYNFTKLDSINSKDDYEENRVFLQLTLQPDQPWRW